VLELAPVRVNPGKTEDDQFVEPVGEPGIHVNTHTYIHNDDITFRHMSRSRSARRLSSTYMYISISISI